MNQEAAIDSAAKAVGVFEWEAIRAFVVGSDVFESLPIGVIAQIMDYLKKNCTWPSTALSTLFCIHRPDRKGLAARLRHNGPLAL